MTLLLSLSLSHTHTNTYTHITHSLSHTISQQHAHSLRHTFPHTNTLAHARAHTHSASISLSFSLYATYRHTTSLHSHSFLSHTDIHAATISLSLSLTHSFVFLYFSLTPPLLRNLKTNDSLPSFPLLRKRFYSSLPHSPLSLSLSPFLSFFLSITESLCLFPLNIHSISLNVNFSVYLSIVALSHSISVLRKVT